MKRILPWLMLILGMGIFIYPFISNWSYEHGVGGMVEAYNESTSGIDDPDREKMLNDAIGYNNSLAKTQVNLNDPFNRQSQKSEVYDSLLDIDGSGILCYIEIPSIHVYLPVFHGTVEKVLQKGAGHLEGTSLPVGGDSTHCVISAHTGLRSSKMFTDLDQMETGDVFYLHTLDQILAYKVDRIKKVLPEQIEYLQIEDGKDEVTLITCTPYGINTHRLLVRGHRIDYEEAKSEIVIEHNGSSWMREYVYAVLTGAGAICLYLLISRIRRRRHEMD